VHGFSGHITWRSTPRRQSRRRGRPNDRTTCGPREEFQDYGVEAIIYTDIGRDGMLTGVNVDATLKLARECAFP